MKNFNLANPAFPKKVNYLKKGDPNLNFYSQELS